MKYKYFQMNLLVVMMAIMSVGFVSCSKEESHDTDSYANTQAILDNLEGMYIGTFTNEMSYGTYERQGTSYTGNLTIKKQTSDLYVIDLICDDYDFRLRIENVSVSKGPNIVNFSISQSERQRLKNKNEYWTIYGNVDANGDLNAAISGYENGKSVHTYHFKGSL